jgi:hypothetical protein
MSWRSSAVVWSTPQAAKQAVGAKRSRNDASTKLVMRYGVVIKTSCGVMSNKTRGVNSNKTSNADPELTVATYQLPDR